jgi:hypothetical protein
VKKREFYADINQDLPCPECGEALMMCQDNHGTTFQCPGHDCMQLFDEDEILEDD